MLVVHSPQKQSSAAADDASEFHSQPLDSQSGAKEPSGGASRSAAAGSKTAAAQPPKSQQARRQLLLPDQHRASNSRGGAQQQDATARGRKGRQSATGAPAAGAEGGGSQTRSRSAAARLATEAAASSSQQQEQQQQQQQQQAAVTADESLGTAAADAATEQQQQQQQQGEGVQSPLREVLEGLWQREEGEVQPSMAQLAEAVWVVGQAALTAKGDCLAFQQQMEQVHKRQGELNQQLKKLLAMPGLQQQPTAAGAVAAASAEAEGLSSGIASMQQQLNAVQQKAEEGGTFLQRAGLGGEDAADKLKTALDAGSEASMKVSNLQTAHGILQGRVNGHDSELQRLKDQLARLEQQQRQQQQQQHNPPALEGAEIVVWAPADPGMADKIAATLTAAARLSKGSVQYVACKFQRRSNSAGSKDSSSSGGNGGGAGSSAAAAAASAAAAAAAGGGSRRKEPLALYVVRLASSSLVPTVLGGRTRLFLRQQGAPMWLDCMLTPEERRQRKQQQSVARELRAKGVQTRWRGHILEERRQRAGGRFQWVQVPPPPPPPSSPPPPLPSPERGPAATDGMAGDVGAS